MNSAITSSSSVSTNPLSPDELRKMNAYWRAANYLSVGQIYLYANPLLGSPSHWRLLSRVSWATGVQLRD